MQALSLKQKTFSAGRWTAASAFIRSALQVLQTVVLARLLLPADFGLMAIVGALLALISLFADLGVSRAIIHYEHISDEALSSLYWVNLGVGILLTLALAVGAPIFAMIYGKPELAPLLLVASPVFVLITLGQQFCVLAEKDLRFATLAGNELVASATGVVVALAVAFRGGGVYALVGAMLATATVGSLLAWWRLSRGHRPRLKLRMAETMPFLRYGAYLVGENFASTLARQADVFVGGAMANASMLGVYSLPRDLSLRLAMVVNPIITRVGFPVMSRLQGDIAALKSVYLQTLRMTASINFPAYVALGLFAPEIVAVLYGPRWHEASGYLRIFAAWGLIRSIGNPVGSLLFAVGHTRRTLCWTLIVLAVTGPLLWLGTRLGGLQGLAWTMLGLQLLLFVPSWLYLVRPACGASLAEFLSAIAIPLLLAMGGGATAYEVAIRLDHGTVRLLIGCSVGAVTYLLLSLWFNRAWTDAMRQLMHLPARSIH